MEKAETISDLRRFIKSARGSGKTIGLVPTMGYLHEGHLALVRAARQAVDFVVVSIFVNPAQFGPGEDFERYPRDLKRDETLLFEQETDLLFYPQVDEMYPPGYQTYVEVRGGSDLLCGAFRPGHFVGVATVVLKLFNQVQPARAFFGEKDAQQLLVIKKMVKDLDLDMEVIGVPTVREADGLAMSSRNVYLSEVERAAAPVVYRGLSRGRTLIEKGEKDPQKVRAEILNELSREPLIKLQYLELVSQEDFQPLSEIKGPVLAALAAFLGKTRLIDNFMLEVKE